MNNHQSIRKNYDFLINQIRKHDIWMNETINLIASENKLSPTAEYCLGTDFGNRVAEGWMGERLFPGLKYYDQIEKYGMELVKSMYNAEFVDIRPISGTIANAIVYTAFTSPGDTILTISINSGAHVSMAGGTPKKVFKLNVEYLPFNTSTYNIDIDKSVEIIQQLKPKMIVLGGSVLLFPQPVKEISAIAKKVKSLVLFDASHVAGLIAGGCYPNPLEEGADIVTMTTCKTIPGPQHAFILSKEEYGESIKRTTFPALHSGHHLNETVASIITMEEFKQFGKQYSEQVIKNAQTLAQAMYNLGFIVLAKEFNFTKTHMFLVDITSIMTSLEAQQLLEQANILVNKNLLPYDTSFRSPSGLRIGTPEVTRIGMSEKDMKVIAKLFHQLLIKKENPKKIKILASNLRNKFKGVKYCY